MSIYVTDTHAFLWYLYNDTRLSPACRAIFEQADAGEARILIPAIVVVEIIYLAEKGRIDAQAVRKTLALLAAAADNYQVVPLDLGLAEAMTRIDRMRVPDMPDRLIAATALQAGVPVLSRDLNISALDVLQVIW